MRELLSAVFKTGAGSLVRILFGFVSTKIVAVALGPSGLGLLSLLQQVRQTALTVGSVNGNAAIVQGIASSEERARGAYVSTVLIICIVGGGIACIGVLVLAPAIAGKLLGQSDGASVALIRWLSVPVYLGVANVYLMGLLNGHRAIGHLAVASGIPAITMAALAYPAAMIAAGGNTIALVWLMICSTLAGLVFAFFSAGRLGYLEPLRKLTSLRFSASAARHFFSIAGTTLVTGLMQTGTLLLMRSIIVQEAGLSGAGVFDAAWTVSMTYVTLILGSFGTYYLPALSATRGGRNRLVLIQRVMRLTTVAMLPLVAGAIVLKPLIIHILYSIDFIPALSILRWMLIADFLRGTSWVLSFTMLAFADMKTLFWSELAWNTIRLTAVYVLVGQYHMLEGAGVSMVITYGTYLVFTVCYAYRRHRFIPPTRIALTWFFSLLLLLAASIHTWTRVHVSWATCAIWIPLALALSWLALRPVEREAVFRKVLRQRRERQ